MLCPSPNRRFVPISDMALLFVMTEESAICDDQIKKPPDDCQAKTVRRPGIDYCQGFRGVHDKVRETKQPWRSGVYIAKH